MSKISYAEGASLLIATETTLGVQPTSGWQTVQVDQDKIGDFYLNVKTAARSPISPERQQLDPEIVDADAAPNIETDLTMDVITQTLEGCMLAKLKHSGNTGTAIFFPTARTTTDYTVAAGGALAAGTIVVADGFSNAANNGVFIVGASSTATAVKVSGGVAETVAAGQLAMLRVAGVRAGSGDITMNASGNLTSTTLDFTTLGLRRGQYIKIGGAAGSAFAFATTAYNGFARIAATPTANLLTLDHRSWTVGSADAGTSKTIELYFTGWIRNVSFLSADYLETSYAMELGMLGIGAAAATEYQYASGCMVNTWSVSAPATALLKSRIGFTGMFVSDPSTTRATGAATATLPLLTDPFNSVTKIPMGPRVMNATTEAVVASDIGSWSIDLTNNLSPQKQQGTYGTKRIIPGKVDVGFTAEVYLTQDDAIKACTANTPLAADVAIRCGNGGLVFEVPRMRFTGAVPKFPANGTVMISPRGGASIDPTGRYTLGVSVFAFLPST